ncbi:MAG: hypothetical protein JWQ71_3284 [Pedosphaera sp.]|nr:hypothetical protein [Pedosphaera sp.]
MKTSLQIPVKLLSAALSGLSLVIQPRSTVAIAQFVRFKADLAGQLTIQACDTTSFVSFHCPNQEWPATDFLFPASALANLVGRLEPHEHITFIQEQPEIVILRCKVEERYVEERIAVISAEHWRKQPDLGEPLVVFDGSFKTGMSEVMKRILASHRAYSFDGLLLDVPKPNTFYVVGNVTHPLFYGRSFNLDLLQPAILPKHRFLGWNGFCNDGAWNFSVQPQQGPAKWVKLKSSNWTFIGTTLPRNYPSWRQVDLDHDLRFQNKVAFGQHSPLPSNSLFRGLWSS